MPSLPAEILLGIYLGLLTGVIPALVAGSLGFIVRYFTGVTLPGLGVVVLALSIASVQGGLLGLLEPEVLAAPRFVVAILIVLMLSLYAHSQGDKIGQSLPRKFSLRELRTRTLSAEAVEVVGGIGQVTVRPEGEIKNIEGYPPLPSELRERIAGGSWRLPADLPITELERRLEDRLRATHDLGAVEVTIDRRGRATIGAAPPPGALSRRVPEHHRAVSVAALVPTGIARRDRVVIETPEGAVTGTVLSARSDPSAAPPPEPGVETDGGVEDETGSQPVPAPTTTGGEGRITVAVERSEAPTLLRAERGRVVVRPRAESHEYELLSLFRRAGYRIRSHVVGAGGAGRSVGAIAENTGATVLAVRSGPSAASEGPARQGRSRLAEVTRYTPRSGSGSRRPRDWRFLPAADATLAEDDEVFVLGRLPELRRLAEVIE